MAQGRIFGLNRRAGLPLVLAVLLGLSGSAWGNVPEGWWNERVFEADMVAGPRAAEFHAQLEMVVSHYVV